MGLAIQGARPNNSKENKRGGANRERAGGVRAGALLAHVPRGATRLDYGADREQDRVHRAVQGGARTPHTTEATEESQGRAARARRGSLGCVVGGVQGRAARLRQAG